MKKVSKPIAIVMALVLALGTFAVSAFAADKAYAHPEYVFTLAGGQNEENAKKIAIGETVYGTVETDGKAVYMIDSTKEQKLTITYKSTLAVNITVSTSGSSEPVKHLENQTDFSMNFDVKDAYYYITFENYVAPTTPPADNEGTGDTENEGTENEGENAQPAPQNEDEAIANEFCFTTSVPNMEKTVKVDCSHKTAELVAGQSLQLKLSNFNIENLNYYWRVLDDDTTLNVDESNIIKVSKDGNITVQPNSDDFNKDTEVKVQAVMYFNEELWTKTVTIKCIPGNIFLNPYYDSSEDNCLTLGEGASRYISATTNVKNGDAKIVWTSGDEEIVKVTAGGKVTGVSVGKANIVATVEIGKDQEGKTVNAKRTILVDVKQNYVSVMGISFNSHSDEVRVNESKVAAYTFQTAPADKNPTNAKVTFTSSDPAVATVDADGKVTGVSAGTATITVTSEDGKYSDTCTFTIKEAIPNWLMVIIAPFRMIYNLIMMIIGK